MTSRAFRVVEMFEEAMAEYAGSKYGVTVDSCTTAIFLSLLHVDLRSNAILAQVEIPARTYISVPFAIQRAGGMPIFKQDLWTGAYRLGLTHVVDSALRMHRGMYTRTSSWLGETFYCVSFHMRKHIKIGRGGMILTDDGAAADWFRRMRFDGRTGSVAFLDDQVEEEGFNAYMLPEQAARGLQLLEALPDDSPDLTPLYPDLSKLPVFNR